jgi:hypothetical protein
VPSCAQTAAVTCTDATTAGCQSDGAGGFEDACAGLDSSAACLAVDADSGATQDCAYTAGSHCELPAAQAIMTLATMAAAAEELTEPASSLSTSGAMTRRRLLSGAMLESSVAVCASCGNGALDGSEIDADCGGLYCDKCADCADGAACTKHGDCAGGQCALLADGSRVCTSCSNGVKETTSAAR